MTREEAYRAAQEKVATARQLLLEAGALMDEHRFTIEMNLGNNEWSAPVKYLPRNLSDVEAKAIYSLEENNLFWHGVDPHSQKLTEHGGMWLSSSEMGDC